MMFAKWCSTCSISSSTSKSRHQLYPSQTVIRSSEFVSQFVNLFIMNLTNDFCKRLKQFVQILYSVSLSEYNLKSIYISSRMKIFSKVENAIYFKFCQLNFQLTFNKSTVL
jgi:hypothetical protein